MRRLSLSLLSLLLPVVMLAAACGDDGGGALGPGVGGGGGDFCGTFEDFDDENQDLDFESLSDPGDIEEAFRTLRSRIDDVASSAPSEIRSDVETLKEGFDAFFDLLEEYDFDLFAAVFAVDEDDPRVQALDNPEFEAASERIAEYCGIDTDTGATDDPFDSSDGELPELPDEFDFETPDFSDVDLDDERAISIEIYKSFGHDQATAECLVDELGDLSNLDTSAGLDTTFCGLTIPQIMTGG